MASPGGDEPTRFVREHHVHYEVEPETVGEGEERKEVGFDVRLFATHGESRLGAPGCTECVELTRQLRSFAEQVVSGHEDRAEIVPASPAVYASAEVPDADEVAVTVRVRCDSPDHRRAQGGDPCLGVIRERLEASGVPRR